MTGVVRVYGEEEARVEALIPGFAAGLENGWDWSGGKETCGRYMYAATTIACVLELDCALDGD
jgi:hypothetical protein